jgi:hypothetical protein
MLGFLPPERLAGFVLSMGLSDLSQDCRVEPNLFSVDDSGKARVMSAKMDDYIQAIEAALEVVPTRLEDGAALCAYAYQGFLTSDDWDRQRAVFVRVFWPAGEEAIIGVPLFEEAGVLHAIGAPEFDAVSGNPNLELLEQELLPGITLHKEGFQAWSVLRRRT